MYFFRSEFDHTGMSTSSQLSVNGQPVGRMDWSTYAYAELAAGERIVDIQPLEDDRSARAGQHSNSDIWARSVPMLGRMDYCEDARTNIKSSAIVRCA
jgi:hypothetical protein